MLGVYLAAAYVAANLATFALLMLNRESRRRFRGLDKKPTTLAAMSLIAIPLFLGMLWAQNDASRLFICVVGTMLFMMIGFAVLA